MAKRTTATKRKPASRKKAAISNSTLSYPEQWLRDVFSGGVEASSGERVNERIAMGIAVYFACIRNISEDIGKLPLGIYKNLKPRGRERQKKHPVDRLIYREPNSEMSAMTWRETITAHALGYCGGFSEIIFNGAGIAEELWPLDPTTVQVMRTQDERRLLFYMVDGVPVAQRNILHIHGLGYSGITGYCIARLAKEAIGGVLAAQKFTGSFFANGTTVSGVLEVPNALSETAFKHLRESFHARHGSADRQHKPLILEQGTKYAPISTDPQKSQMAETLTHGIEEIARLFRMPPHKIGHLLRSTFSNIEHQAQEYVTDTLGAWIERWEEEIDRKLLLPRERDDFFARHNTNALLRGDTAARATFYREMFNIGAMSVNDIREYEDLNPVEGGDTYFVNAALVPLEMAAEGEHLQQNQPESTPEPPESTPETSENGETDEEAKNEFARRRAQVLKIAEAHRNAIREELRSLLQVEYNKFRAAAKLPNGKQSMADFYENSHQQEWKKRLSPHFEALAAGLEAAAWN